MYNQVKVFLPFFWLQDGTKFILLNINIPVISHNAVKFYITLFYRSLSLGVLFRNGQKWSKVAYLILKVVVRSLFDQKWSNLTTFDHYEIVHPRKGIYAIILHKL